MVLEEQILRKKSMVYINYNCNFEGWIKTPLTDNTRNIISELFI